MPGWTSDELNEIYYAAYIIDAITSDDARATTLKLVPRAVAS